jgi:flagellar hook-length control protein FliK
VVDQVAMAARLSSQRNGTERVQLRLHPQALGELVIEVSWKESGIVASIKAQSHITGELLAGDLGRLKTALGEQGIPVSGLGVQVGVDLREWSDRGQTPHSPARTAASHPLTADSAAPIADSRAWEPDSLIDIRV